MRKPRRVGFWILAGVMGMLIAGCAKPPVAEQSAAQAAKNAAQSIQAENYAAGAWNEAVQAWDNAESKMRQGAYNDAKAAYLAAQAAFVKAAGEVEAGKAVVREENDKALQTLDKGWVELSKVAKKRIKSLKGIAKTAWDTDAKIIAEALKKAKDVATDPSELKKALAQANDLVAKWLAAFKK